MNTTRHRSVPTRVKIARGESLFGFMTRVASANNYDRSMWLLDDLWTGCTYDTSRWSPAAIDQIANITATPVEDIASRIYSDAGGSKLSFFGHSMARSLIAQSAFESRMNYCPECLTGGIHHAIFDLVIVTVCPIHARRISDRCPHCNRLTLWGHHAIDRCKRCDGDLTTAATEKIDPTTLRGLRAFVDLLHVDCPQGSMTRKLPKPLAHLGWAEALELALGLANYLGSRPSDSTFVNFTASAMERLHLMLNTAWSFIEKWPRGFDAFLEVYQEKIGTNEILFGAQNAFGNLYNYLRLAESEPWLTAKAAFESFLEERWQGNAIRRASPTSNASINFRPGTLSIAETAKLLDRSPERVKHLLDIGVLKGQPTGNYWGAPIFIKRADVERIAPKGRPPLRLEDVGALLNIPRQRQTQFVDEGILVPVLGPAIDGSKVYLFKASDAQDILDDLAKHARSTDVGPRPQSVSNILKGAAYREVPGKTVITALREGVLTAAAIRRDKIGLDAFVFKRQEVRTVLANLERQRQETQRAQFMSVPAVGARLGLSLSVVYALIAAGFLHRAPREVRSHIYRESVDSFEREWHLISRLAKELETSTPCVHKALRDANIPVEVCGTASNYTSFVRRSLLHGAFKPDQA